MNSMSGGRGLSGATGAGMGEKIPSGYKKGRMQNYDQNQMNLYNQSFSQVAPDSYTARLAGGDQSMFDEIEAPAQRQFAGMQGNMASRFSGMGQGARNSSGFQNSMNQAGSDFAQNLQSNRQSMRQQAIKDMMGMSHQLLNEQPFDNFMVKKENKPSFMQKLMGGALPLAGAAAGGYFGGPAGMAAGASLGGAAAGGFSGNGGGGSVDWSGISQMPTSWGQRGIQGASGRQL